MAGMSPYAAAPPPPPIGGNRKSKLIVGGQTSNLGYTAGADLQNARTAYQTNQQMGVPQNALQRGFIQGQAQGAPDFTQSQTNQMQAGQGLTTAQAQGRQLQQNTLGQVRPANAPQGLGYGRSNALGVVRQHTISGNEGLDPSMTYTPTAAPPPPPPPTTTTATSSTSTTANPATTNPNHAGPSGPTGWTVPAGTPAPIYPSGFSVDMFKWNNLNVWSAPLGRYVAKDISQMSTQDVFNALANGQNNGALADGYYLADKNTIKKGTPPATAPPAPTAPAPTAPAPSGPAPAPAPTVTGSQAVRQQYSGKLNKGVRVYGSDGKQRIVQYMGKSPSGAMVPWVNKPGGGYMIHPDWQGI